MSDIINQLMAYMFTQPHIIQGFIMCFIATGIPGPLNLIAVHKTIHNKMSDAYWFGLHFAGWFTAVGLLSIILSYVLLKLDVIAPILSYFKNNEITIMKTGAIISIIAAIFMYFKENITSKIKQSSIYIFITSLPLFSQHPEKPTLKHANKILASTLMSGILFFPGNWIVFTGSYAALKKMGK